MEEAKTLLHHALSALFAVLILAAIMALIGLGNLMWRAFSKQADANLRMKEYAKFSAFDGTTVRGQDVIALLHQTQGSPFVVICNNSGGVVNMIATDVDSDYDIHTCVSATPTALPTVIIGNYCEAVLAVQGLAGGTDAFDVSIKGYLNTDNNTDSKSYINYSAADVFRYDEMQEWFLARGAIVSGEAGYLPYDSYLLYDSEDSTDIVGVILYERTGG